MSCRPPRAVEPRGEGVWVGVGVRGLTEQAAGDHTAGVAERASSSSITLSDTSITYPRTSHSMKGVMYAHPAQRAKPKICTLVLGQGFGNRLEDCFDQMIARSKKQFSLYRYHIGQGLIWCLVQAKHSLLICQCWVGSVNGCLFASKSIIWMYWLKRIFPRLLNLYYKCLNKEFHSLLVRKWKLDKGKRTDTWKFTFCMLIALATSGDQLWCQEEPER